MQNIFKSGILALIMMAFIHCNSGSNPIFPDTFSKLPGIWKLENSNTYEIWENRDSLFVGKVVTIERADTVLLENLRVIKIENEIFYEAAVINQNKGLPVKFKLVFIDEFKLQFENQEHDFPKTILYSFIDKNEFSATVSNTEKTIKFNYLRIE